MAHYALIDSNNVVVQVITGVDEEIIQYDNGQPVGGSSEAWEQFYESRPWFANLKCKRTSYNGNIRQRFAGIGMIYDEVQDVFLPRKPFPSWILGADNDWHAPIPKPDEGYVWIEDILDWVHIDVLNSEVSDNFI